MNKFLFFAVFLSVGWGFAETISVPAGETRVVEAGRRFEGEMLVKEGEGVLDLSGAVLANAGLDIRGGEVRFSASGNGTVNARYVRLKIHGTRPGKRGAPEYAESGPQYGELVLMLGGKKVAWPEGAKASGGREGSPEGPEKAIDGNYKTKYYCHTPLVVDALKDIAFDSYTLATGFDAIGRDPRSWTLDAGFEVNGALNWVTVSSVDDFEMPKARCAEVGRIFPAVMKDRVPAGYALKIGGKGTLHLQGLTESLENCSGEGLIVVDDGTVQLGAKATFTGSVSGTGKVYW